jgi:hypothetical protein
MTLAIPRGIPQHFYSNAYDVDASSRSLYSRSAFSSEGLKNISILKTTPLTSTGVGIKLLDNP